MDFDRITIHPDCLGGRTCIRDLRLSVQRVVEAAAIYPDRDKLLCEYPELEEEDVCQALFFAAALLDSKGLSLPAAS